MRTFIVMAICLWIGFPSEGSAENLIFNSGFELGTSGFECVRYLRPDTNPEMKYQNPVIDTSTYASGRQSLKIPNPFSEQVTLHTHEFKLKPETKYTLSLWMKSTNDDDQVRLQVYAISADLKWDVRATMVKIGKQWKRYSYTFTTPGKNYEAYYQLKIWLCRESDASAGNIWLDDLQITAGELRKYQPGSNIEVGVVPDQKLYIMEGTSGSARVDVVVCNNSSQTQKADFTIKLIPDNENGNRAAEKTIKTLSLKLPPGQTGNLALDLKLDSFGAFRVAVENNGKADLKAREGFFAVVGKCKPGPVDINKTFCVSVNTGINARRPDPWGLSRKKSFPAMGLSPDGYISLFAAMGCRLIRDWGGNYSFLWEDIEPREGHFDFRRQDEIVKQMSKHGISLLPVLGGYLGFGFESSPNSRPPWLKAQCKTRPKIRKSPIETNAYMYLTPMDKWRRFIREIGMRYKGTISNYEIINEPNLDFHPSEYVEYLNAAYEVLKAADSKCHVVGFCSTSDLGGAAAPFLKECFKLGGLKYADIISFHPYKNPSLASVQPADELIAGIKNLAAEYGKKDHPLWNTELFYLTGEGANYQQKSICRPQDIAQRFLTDLGEGVGQSISIFDAQLWKAHLAPHVSPGGTCSAYQPSARFVAYNALARLFEGAKPVTGIDWGNDTICYVYECRGKYLAAFWNYGNQNMNISLEMSDKEAVLYDLFGNRQDIETLSGELTAAPRYLSWENNDKSRFITRLKNAIVKPDKPMSISPVVRIFPTGEGGFMGAFGIKNLTNKAITGKAGLRGSSVVALKMVDFFIAANQQETIFVPIKIKKSKDQNVEIKLYVNAKLWSFNVTLLPLRESCLTPGESVKIQKASTKGKVDHKADFSFGNDRENFHLEVHVRDNTPSGVAGGRKDWEQDCVEIFIDPEPAYLPLRYPRHYYDRVVRLFVLPYAPAGKRLVIWPNKVSALNADKIRLNVETSSDGYRVRLSLALSDLGIKPPVAGKYIGFDLAVDDAKGTRPAASTLCWSSEGIAYRDRCSFGIIKLK